MSYFNSLTLTTKGQEILLSSNTNIDKKITFTNASLGSEKLLPDEIKGATEIKNFWLKFPLNTVRIINDESNYFLRTEIAFTNAGIIENKIMRELGIYAKFENEEEVLFAYSTTNDDGETIPKEDIVPATYKFTIDATISTETKINQTLSPEGFLTKEVVELLKENIRNIAFRKIQGTLIANQKVIQVPTDILLPISERAILNIEGEIYFLGRDYTIDIHANTITLNDRYNFKEGTQYEIIDPLPATYVKEQIQEFIDDFKKLVSDSKIDFDKLKDKIYLEFQEKVDSFYLQLDEFIEQNKEDLKGHSIDRIVENGKDENGGNIYNIFRDDNKNVGTMVAPRGLRGNGIANPNYKGKNENGDALYSWILEDGTETTETTIMPKGENGKSFYFSKEYSSIVEMEADFQNDNINIGDYVIICSDDDDNAKLFEKKVDKFDFIVQMGFMAKDGETITEIHGSTIGNEYKIDLTLSSGTIKELFLDRPIFLEQVGVIREFIGTNIPNGFIFTGGGYLEKEKYPWLEGKFPLVVTGDIKRMDRVLTSNSSLKPEFFLTSQDVNSFKMFDNDESTVSSIVGGFISSPGYPKLSFEKEFYLKKIKMTLIATAGAPTHLLFRNSNSDPGIIYPIPQYVKGGVAIGEKFSFDVEIQKKTYISKINGLYIYPIVPNSDGSYVITQKTLPNVIQIEVYGAEEGVLKEWFEIPNLRDEFGNFKIVYVGTDVNIVDSTGTLSLDYKFKRNYLKQQRDLNIMSEIEVDGIIFDGDIKSMNNIDDAIYMSQYLPTGTTQEWITAKNEVVLLDIKSLEKIKSEWIMRKSYEFHKYNLALENLKIIQEGIDE